MGKPNPIHEKAISYSIRVVNLYKYLSDVKKEFVLSKQLLRSGTSIGALIHESEFAESKLDFIHKLHIALKEANESVYWLEILHKTDFITDIEYVSLEKDTRELIKMLVSIIKTTKDALKK